MERLVKAEDLALSAIVLGLLMISTILVFNCLMELFPEGFVSLKQLSLVRIFG